MFKPEIARSLENVNGADLSNRSAVTGTDSMLLPLNLYIPPLSEGIIRTNCPLLVSCNRKLQTSYCQCTIHLPYCSMCSEHVCITVTFNPQKFAQCSSKTPIHLHNLKNMNYVKDFFRSSESKTEVKNCLQLVVHGPS